MHNSNKHRDGFSSSVGIWLALAGSAVGLGNMWRFPYLVGTNGGAAFIFIYLFFVFVLALPIMCAEFVVGRRAQSNVYGAFRKLAPGTRWGVTGMIAIICCVIVMGFYSVVGGWSLTYLWKSLTFNLVSSDTAMLAGMFDRTVTSTFEPVGFMLLFVLLSAIVLLFGVKKGIERWSKVLMPLMFFMVVFLAVRSSTLPGAGAGLDFLFKPDFSKVTDTTVLEALGQAFLSLSIGFGIVLTYASYARKESNVLKLSTMTCLSDTAFSVISGLAIMPAVFAFGLPPGQGPGLVFVTLPFVFSKIMFGAYLAILFFFVLFIAALTSSISMLEVVVAYVAEEFKISRRTAILGITAVVVCLGVVNSMSQGAWSFLQIAGYNFFDICDKFTANVLMPLGALLIVLFVGWHMAPADFADEMSSGGRHKLPALYFSAMRIIIKYVSPVVIAIIMARGIYVNMM